MQMYVNYYDRKVKLEDENPTIGIIICKDKKDAVVKMTLPKDNNQILASKYQTVPPSKEELQQLMNEKEQIDGMERKGILKKASWSGSVMSFLLKIE